MVTPERPLALVCLSGGMDSATVALQAMKAGNEVVGVHFQYGSKHNKYELHSASELALHYHITLWELDLSEVFKLMNGSALMQDGDEIPEGHYEDENMKQTVVPGRNLVMAAVLGALAMGVGAEYIYLGIHSGDHAIYPDCRPEFFSAMKDAILAATNEFVTLRAPFLNMDKGQILELGTRMGVPYGLTRTCYKDQPTPCGKCGACVERAEAFEKLGLADPAIPDEISE